MNLCTDGEEHRSLVHVVRGISHLIYELVVGELTLVPHSQYEIVLVREGENERSFVRRADEKGTVLLMREGEAVADLDLVSLLDGIDPFLLAEAVKGVNVAKM